MEPRSPEYLTIAEAAALLRVSRKTIEAAARRGELPSECVGRQRRFLRRALDAHFSRYREAGTDPAASWPDVKEGERAYARKSNLEIAAGGRSGGGRGQWREPGTDSGESARRRKASGAEKGFLRAALVSLSSDSLHKEG